MKVKIRENSILARLAALKLRTRKVAVTIGQTIYLHNTTREQFLSDQDWTCHELAHVQQFRSYGLLPFLFLYTWESIWKGYRQNKWEIEARSSEKDHGMLSGTEFI